MFKEMFLKIYDFVGPKVGMVIILLFLGGLGFYFVQSNVVTYSALAQETSGLRTAIQSNQTTQELNILYLREQMANKSVEEAEDNIEKKPASHKWKKRLDRRGRELDTIKSQIIDKKRELKSYK